MRCSPDDQKIRRPWKLFVRHSSDIDSLHQEKSLCLLALLPHVGESCLHTSPTSAFCWSLCFPLPCPISEHSYRAVHKGAAGWSGPGLHDPPLSPNHPVQTLTRWLIQEFSRLGQLTPSQSLVHDTHKLDRSTGSALIHFVAWAF